MPDQQTPNYATLGKYVDLRYDTAFKIVFKRPEVLIPFLNTFMALPPERHIKAVTYKDKEQNPGLQALLHHSQVANLSPEQMNELIYEIDRAALAQAELTADLQDAKAEGREEAEAKAYQEKLAIARSLKATGQLSLAQIAEATKLPLPVVEGL